MTHAVLRDLTVDIPFWVNMFIPAFVWSHLIGIPYPDDIPRAALGEILYYYLMNNRATISISSIHQQTQARQGWCISAWWRNQMETVSALMVICAGNSPVPGEYPTQRLVTRSSGVVFDLHPNKRLSKQWWGWGFETPSYPLWCHRNVIYLPWKL